MLFENAKRDSNLTLFKILRAFKEMHKEVAQKSNAIRSSPVFGKDLAWRFFYGACQGKEGRYGGGMALFLGEKHYFHLQLRASVGTNTRVELLALWGLLFFARSKGILSLQVVEDSKVIINWFFSLSARCSLPLSSLKMIALVNTRTILLYVTISIATKTLNS